MEVNPSLEERLKDALAECARLQEENRNLRSKLGIEQSPQIPILPAAAPLSSEIVTNLSPVEKKISLFKSYFRGRKDVYTVRWESRQGKSGYSPACTHEWNRGLCEKPRIKCGECKNRELLPFMDEVFFRHLSGEAVIGLYPLLQDETCFLIAVDFDKDGWHEDVKAYLDVCRENNIDALLERSRSGNGGHIWIFFETAMPAVATRKLGTAILTKAMEKRHLISFDSYDRFFPNQDTLPKGGFGNLIALPLQKEAKLIFTYRTSNPFSSTSSIKFV